METLAWNQSRKREQRTLRIKQPRSPTYNLSVLKSLPCKEVFFLLEAKYFRKQDALALHFLLFHRQNLIQVPVALLLSLKTVIKKFFFQQTCIGFHTLLIITLDFFTHYKIFSLTFYKKWERSEEELSIFKHRYFFHLFYIFLNIIFVDFIVSKTVIVYFNIIFSSSPRRLVNNIIFCKQISSRD